MKINEFLSENEQLDELGWKDIQKGAAKVTKGANKFTKNVADTGAAVGQAAGAVGGAIKQVGKTAIADPVAATYNAAKGGLTKAADVAANTYSDVKAGATKVGQAIDTVQQDTGNAAKSLGRNVANAVGGVAGTAGAVAGGATTGAARAAVNGYNTGVQAVGGDAPAGAATVFKNPGQQATTAEPAAAQAAQATEPAADAGEPQIDATSSANIISIKQQITKKQEELAALQSQLDAVTKTAQAQAQSTKPKSNAGAKVAGAIDSLSQAFNRGVGMGATGQSVADQSYDKEASADSSLAKVKDSQGKEHNFKKVGAQWFDEKNQPVSDAQAAMLDQQTTATQPKDVQARMAKQLGTAQPASAVIPQTGGPQPTTGAKAVLQPAPATQPAQPAPQAASDPRDLNKDGTVDATEKSIARNKAKQPEMASFDPSAALLRKMKTRV